VNGSEEARRLNHLTREIIGAGIDVHREIGPGLLESAYEACMTYELTQRRLAFERQKPLPVVYRTVKLDCGYKLDFVVEDAVVLELKAVQSLENVHKMQLLTYLRLSGKSVGLLMNFNVEQLRNGIVRIANRFPN
jgi:GxxExxY protein